MTVSQRTQYRFRYRAKDGTEKFTGAAQEQVLPIFKADLEKKGATDIRVEQRTVTRTYSEWEPQ